MLKSGASSAVCHHGPAFFDGIEVFMALITSTKGQCTHLTMFHLLDLACLHSWQPSHLHQVPRFSQSLKLDSGHLSVKLQDHMTGIIITLNQYAPLLSVAATTSICGTAGAVKSLFPVFQSCRPANRAG